MPPSRKKLRSLGADPARSLTILDVKVLVIQHLLASSPAASDGRRLFFPLACVSQCPLTLDPNNMESFVTETYTAVVSKLRDSRVMATKCALRPITHTNFNLWTSPTSNVTNLGECKVHVLVEGCSSTRSKDVPRFLRCTPFSYGDFVSAQRLRSAFGVVTLSFDVYFFFSGSLPFLLFLHFCVRSHCMRSYLGKGERVIYSAFRVHEDKTVNISMVLLVLPTFECWRGATAAQRGATAMSKFLHSRQHMKERVITCSLHLPRSGSIHPQACGFPEHLRHSHCTQLSWP